MMIIVFTLTVLGMYLLFISSEKYRSPKSTGYFKTLAQKSHSLLRISACLLFVLSGFILIRKNGLSIGFVSWWIFASPLTFALILLINPLKPSK
ncbi:DUF1634 domain-containing protein [Acinetobacter seifertii]|jgi:hypothetical protein|uniref:DUF1634 domain-containing protein n=1 Tax=Acinetobacter seifertii TaxID=1530123 RepID=UPI000C1E57A6|nr:DUF1634 domain-containing protein [Acinetobacter seifertii]PJF02843.1 DUF1634 domain-containing protein [Acinetobacter seifertii]PJG69739.1 DUF1634 domain-containing protein [Acinetobacter seifertii]